MAESKRDPGLDALADDFERGDYDLVPGTDEVDPAPHTLPMGRPLEPRGGASPLRAARLPRELDEQLVHYLDVSGQQLSTVMRAALAEYMERHPA